MGKSIWDTRFNTRGIAQDLVIRDDDRWITMNGAHVLLSRDGYIRAGAEGKFNGMHVSGFGRPDAAKYAEHKKDLEDIYDEAQSEVMGEADWLRTDRQHFEDIKNNPSLSALNPDIYGTRDEKINRALSSLFAKYANDYMKEHEVRNPPKALKEPMSEGDAISRIAGADKTEGSCASAAMAFIANQELGLDVRDYRGGVSQLGISMSASEAAAQVLESDYDPKAEGGRVFTESDKPTAKDYIKALDSMQSNKNYVAMIGRHEAVVRKLDSGEIQYLELQGNDSDNEEWAHNGWQTIAKGKDAYGGKTAARNAEIKETLEWRFLYKEKGKDKTVARFSGIMPADRYAQTDYVKNSLQYVNTSGAKQMKGEGGWLK